MPSDQESIENQWLFIVDSEKERHQYGPVSTGDLEVMLSAGKITTDTLVWHDGMPEWSPISTVPDLAQPYQPDSSPDVVASMVGEPSETCRPQDALRDEDPTDKETIREFDNHTVQFSKSRNLLLITTNDYHAGPLVLTKLDLLGFLTAIEISTQQSKASKSTGIT